MLCTIFTFQLCEMMEDENGKMDLRNTVYIEYERGISIDREFKLIYFLFIFYDSLYWCSLDFIYFIIYSLYQ